MASSPKLAARTIRGQARFCGVTAGTAQRPDRITVRNAAFQQWLSLLTNRTQRHRAGSFLVPGVRAITIASERGWPFRAILSDGRDSPSTWASTQWAALDTRHVIVAPELMRELGGKDDDVPELVAVLAIPPDDLGRLPTASSPLVVVFDRPSSPGNIGTLAPLPRCARRRRARRHRARRRPL